MISGGHPADDRESLSMTLSTLNMILAPQPSAKSEQSLETPPTNFTAVQLMSKVGMARLNRYPHDLD